MKASTCMHPSPIVCNASDTLTHAAQLMRNFDIGFLPVVERDRDMKGVITDRDIITRAIALGKDPDTTPVSSCMSTPVIFAHINHELGTCLELMKEHQVKRIAIVDMGGTCCGVVSQKDLSESLPAADVGDVSRRMTEPT